MSGLNNSLNAPFPLSATQGGLGVASPTAHGILVAEGASAATPIVLTAGQVLIGTTSSDPAAATLTQGTGISITSSSGSITIAATGSGTTWNSVSGTTQTLAAANGYISNSASLTTYTLPTTAAVGDTYTIMSSPSNTAFSKIAQNSGQSIQFGNAVTGTGAGGSLTGTAVGDTLRIVCVVANTGFQVLESIGNFTVA